MEKVTIKRNPNGDTRTAGRNVTFAQFKDANFTHAVDVSKVMKELGVGLKEHGISHDWTKFEYEDEFYDDFISTINYGTDFVSEKWYQRHIQEERHHLNDRCPEDVNLLDVIEMIVDCVCAGKTRSGVINVPELSEEILKKAYDNTIDLVDKITEVE